MSLTAHFSLGRKAALLFLILALVAFSVFTAVRTASAASFTVNSTADKVDASPGNGVCKTSSGVCTLRAAVQEANALPGNDTINLPAGTYTLTLVGAGEGQAVTGDLDIHDEVTIVGAGSGATIIDATGLSDRVFDVNSTNLLLSGVTVRGGNVAGDGGALRLLEAAAELTDVVLSNNTASGSGGAVYAGTADVVLRASAVSGNSAGGTGGIHLSDYFTNLTLEDTDVADAIFVDGGALLLNGVAGGAVDGVISGTTNLEKIGAGPYTLAGANTYSGDTAVAAGTLQLTAANALAGTSGGVTISDGATLDVSGFDQVLRNLSGDGDVINAGAVILANSSNTVFNGDMPQTGSMELTKTGLGRLTLGGTVTADVMNVSEGDLAVNGTLLHGEGSATVAGGATLYGTGVVRGFAAIEGKLQPGASPGILTFDYLLLDEGATYRVEIADNVPGDNGYDQVIVNGGVEIGSDVTLDLISYDYSPYFGDTFTVIDNRSGSPVTGAFKGLPEGALVDADFLGSGLPAFISYQGGDGDDVVVTVGEPEESDTFTVNTTADDDDGTCNAAHCSLREAINAANASPNSEGPQRITFEIAGSGVATIQPTAALPTITDAVIIDGAGGVIPDGPSTAEDIVLDGALAGAGVNGLTIDGNNSRIEGLTITGFDGAGIAVLGGQGNTFAGNSMDANGGLGIDLGADGVTRPDFFDLDSGPNGLQNAPTIQRVYTLGSEMRVQGILNSAVSRTFTVELFSSAACDGSFYGEGATPLTTLEVTTDASGFVFFTTTLPTVLPNNSALTATATDIVSGDTSEFSRCTVVGPNNDTWVNAYEIPLSPVSAEEASGSAAQYLTAPGQTRWFRFPVAPGSKVIVDLSELPANYDLTLFRDIAQTYAELSQPQGLDDLAQLSAEFAPEMFTPEMFTPEMFTPEMFTPEMFTPEMFTPEMFTPEMFTPEMFTPEMFTPEMFTPEMFTPEMFTPEMFTPEMFTPEMFTPAIFVPEMFTPEMFTPDQRYYAGALAQSAVAVSAFDGTAAETVVANSWSEAGDFYVSVSGRNGAFDPTAPFNLQVTVLGAECNGLTIFDAQPDVSGISGGSLETLILVDSGRMSDYAAVAAKLEQLRAHPAVNGAIVDVGQFPAIAAANDQADRIYQCVFAKNVVAYGIKEIVDAYRATSPNLKYIVVVGNDEVIPFFRYPDLALLANESGYVPPVLDPTASQASLRNGYVLGQDTYGAAVEIDRRNTSVPVPGLAVGRLVENAAEINAAIDAFLASGGTVPSPSRALVTGYDFLADAASAIEADLAAGLGSGGTVNTLVDQATVAPVNGWTADDLRAALLQNGRHDLIYLAGHFSSFSTLAADNQSRVLAEEVLASSVDMSNTIVFSNGCHSGYNLVAQHAVPNVSIEPDWAQVFTRKGAILIAGTGYQYGDTDFVEYGERLYFQFSRELRRGSGPVAVGEALVRAKQVYLAETAEMRPIHEKTLLIATLFGLPMTTIDMPGARYNPPGDTLTVAPQPVAGDPGAQLNLKSYDLTVTPALSRETKTLENVVDDTSLETVYYRPASGRLVINPGEPILPLDRYELRAGNTVLRGVGFRGGRYTDRPNQIPLVGAATTELRGIHTPFISNVFYPVTPWDVNYYDVLATSFAEGAVGLGVIPVQYRSNGPEAVAGTMRVYEQMDFRLFFSDNTAAYTNTAAGVTNIPALAGPPSVARVVAESDGGAVTFTATVTGDPSAGIQAVWVTYTGSEAPFAGRWASLDLTQDAADSRIWRGTLDLQGTAAGNLRYLVQAANGVGLVALDTNKGAYYTPDVDPAAPGTPPGSTTPPEPVELALLSPPASGEYGTAVTFSARLTRNGAPLAGEPLDFGLTTQRQTALTDANGRATATLTVIGDPAADTVRVTYAGSPGLAAASASAPFTINPIATNLTLLTAQPTFSANGPADLSVALTDATGRPQPWRWVLVVVEDGSGGVVFAESVQTDLFGNANLLTANLAPGSYTVHAYFASQVSLPGIGVIDMRLPRFRPTETPAAGDPPITLVTNTPPTADAGGPYTVAAGESVLLDAGGSSDVDAGQALTYAWDLDDNGTFESPGVTVTFSAAGINAPTTRTVAVRVCDPVDDCDVATTTVNVTAVAGPAISVALPFVAYEGRPVTFEATLAPNGHPEPFAITWTFGDGATASDTLTPSHTYAAPGVYEVTVTAESADGATATATVQVTVFYGFMEACAYAADAGDTLTLEQNARVECIVRAEGGAAVKKDAFIAGTLYAVGGDVKLDQAAAIGGDLLSGGRVDLEKEATVDGDVGAGGDVRLKKDAAVGGDVRAAGRVTLDRGATVGGAIVENGPPPQFPPSSALALTLSAGGQDVAIGKNATQTLTPGVFGKLTVNQGATLRLSSGRYQFDEWKVAKDAKIEFDVSGGAIIIDVVGNVSLDKNVAMRVIGGGAEQILFRSSGDSFKVDKDSALLGTYLMPAATADLQQNVALTGAIYAGRLKVAKDVDIVEARALPVIGALLADGALGGD